LGIPERKEREKEQRKEEIVDAAQKVFFEKGLQSATMDDIADSAELSKGTIYLYYKSKEDLYLAVVMRGMLLLEDICGAKLQSESEPVRALLSLMEAYLEFFRAHREYFRMFQFLQTPQFHKQASEEMKEACLAISRKTWNMAIHWIQRGIDDGLFAPDLNAGEVAVILWSSATSLMTRMDTPTDMWKNKMEIDLERVMRLSNALLFDAVLTPLAKKQYAPLLKEYHPRFDTILP